MSDFDQAIALVLENEGSGYREDDYGRGPSRWGITLKTYKLSHPDATSTDIYDMTREGAAAFYKTEFWYKYNIYNIKDQDLATKTLDLAVLDGPGTAIRWLQNAIGTVPDGLLGGLSIKAVNAAADPKVILQRIRAQAEDYYRRDVAHHPAKQKELNGWLARLDKTTASAPTANS